MDLVRYIKKFINIWGVLTGAFSLGPLGFSLILKIVQSYHPSVLWFVIVMTVICLMSVPTVVYQFRNTRFVLDKQKRGKKLIVLIMLFFIFLILYSVFAKAVVRAETMADGTTIQLIIGLNRSELSNTKYQGLSDEEILFKVGWDEEGVRKGWTLSSICLAHGLLLFFYLSIFFPIIFLFSFVVLFDYVDSLSSSTIKAGE